MYNFQVNDMTCGHCASRVETAVKNVDASAQVKVDISARKVEVQSTKPAETFIQAIGEAGYTGELQG